jgi:hypothetical protein
MVPLVPFVVDPSWYERYWLRERPARRRWTALSRFMEFARQSVHALGRDKARQRPALTACDGATRCSNQPVDTLSSIIHRSRRR